MGFKIKPQRSLVDENQIDLFFEEILQNNSFIKESREKKRKIGVDPDFLNKYFSNDNQKTEFFETAPLVFFAANKTDPTIEDFETVISNPYFQKELGSGSTSITNLFKNITDPHDKETLLQAISYLGRQSYISLKENSKLGKFRIVDFIRNSINQYRNAIPESLRAKGSKPNTADVILVFKGTRKDVIDYIKNLDIEGEKISELFGDGIIGDDNVKFIQVSMKKEESSARIGKVLTKVLDILKLKHSAKKGFVPEQPESEILQEGILTNVWEYIKTKAKSLYEEIKNIGQTLLIFFNAKTTYKSIFDKNTAEMSRILGIDINTLSMNEESGEKINIKDKDILEVTNRIKGKLLPYKERLEELEADPKNKKLLFKLVINDFYTAEEIDNIANNLIREKTRTNFAPLTKLNANVSAMEFFIIFVEKAFSSNSAKEMYEKFEQLSKEVSVESAFGDTLLPLWKFFGGEKGIQFLGLRLKPKKDISKIEEKKFPIFIFNMHRAKERKSTWNVAILYSIDTSKLTFNPQQKYFVIEMTTESGSKFTFKIEINKTITYEKVMRE